jgi:hypothetical protein
MNGDSDLVFTPETLGDALTELGQLAYEAGHVIDVAVYGGSCLMLVSNFRTATADVDAVAADDQSFLDSAAQTIAERRGWPRAWLNDGVRTYLSPLVDGFEQHELFRTYPSEQTPGLRAFVPTPEYMLAMKLMALRLDPGGGRNDLALPGHFTGQGRVERAAATRAAGRAAPEALDEHAPHRGQGRLGRRSR